MKKLTQLKLPELEEEENEHGLTNLADLKPEDYLFNYNEKQAKKELRILADIEQELGMQF